MNENNLHQIFQNYINRFDEINTKYTEYYKWQVAFQFHETMDAALEAPVEQFASKLKEAKKLSSNLIDSFTQPFQGLVRYAESSDEAANEVKDMFINLLKNGKDDIDDKQKRVDQFLSKSLDIRERVNPGSYLYKDDFHSVTGYLFLYDPEHNYFFKASHGKDFADCIEFYDDWGNGNNVKLAPYYRMCDWVVKQIKESKELLATNEYRYNNLWNNPAEGMHPDVEKHILCFDIIYCCSNYGLFHGIEFTKPKLKERQLILERKKKAIECAEALEIARANKERLDEALAYLDSVCAQGTLVNSSRYGDGVIIDNSDGRLLVDFSKDGERLLGTVIAFCNGIISIDKDGFIEWINENKTILKDASNVSRRLESAEKEFEVYSEYLD